MLLHGCTSGPTTVPEPPAVKRPAQTMDNWAVFEGQADGRTIRLRRAIGLESKIDRQKYPFLATVSYAFNADASGQPADEAAQAILSDVEDSLVRALEVHDRCLYCGVITVDGVRTFVFYTKDKEAVKNIVANLQSKVQGGKLDLDIALDRDWQLYSDLQPSDDGKLPDELSKHR